jgi:hypothetical protein
MHIRMHYLWYFDNISKTGDADVFTHRLTSIFAIFFRAYAFHLAIRARGTSEGRSIGRPLWAQENLKKDAEGIRERHEALIADVKANHRAISRRSRMSRVRRVMPIIRQAHWARVGGRVLGRELG